MKILNIVLLTILLITPAFSADNILCDGNGSTNCTLIDSAGNKWSAKMSFTTNGNGDIYTLGDIASSDQVIGVNSSSNRTLIDNIGRRWSAAVTYTTDGHGNVIPVPSGGILSLHEDVTASGPGSAAATVNSVGGSTAANVHAAELAANYPTLNLPASQMRYVNKSGNDANNCTITLPCLTPDAAEASITDATSSKLYAVHFGPGTFTPLSGFVKKNNISWIGSGNRLTIFGLANIGASGGLKITTDVTSGSNTVIYKDFAMQGPGTGMTFNNTDKTVSSTATIIGVRIGLGTSIVFNGSNNATLNLIDSELLGTTSAQSVFLFAYGTYFGGRVTGDVNATANASYPPFNVAGCGTTSGSQTVSVPSLGSSGVAQGMLISGPGIPVNTRVGPLNVGANTINISAPATATATVSLSFQTPLTSLIDIFHSTVSGLTMNNGSGGVVAGTYNQGNIILNDATLNSATTNLSVTPDVLKSTSNSTVGAASSLTRLTQASALAYTPAVSGNWITQPVNASDAIDILASRETISRKTSVNITDRAAGGNIGTAASTVDIGSIFFVNQTTAGQTLTIPSPTATASVRNVILANSGSASFTAYGQVIAPNTAQEMIWTGSAWEQVAEAISLAAVGSSPNSSGASASGMALTLQPADGSNPGLMTAGTQSIGGDKTFLGNTILGNGPGNGEGATPATLNLNQLTDIPMLILNANNDSGFTGDLLQIYQASGGFLALKVQGDGLLNVNGNKILQVADPTLAQDAATKHYVDSIASESPAYKRYINFVTGDDSTGTGSDLFPWKTIQAACTAVTGLATVNTPYTIYVTGGNNDTDSGAVSCPPNINIVSDYPIQVTGTSFTITGGSTNDSVSFTNLIFLGAFSWIRSDATAMGVQFRNAEFFNGPTIKQNGAGSASITAYDTVTVNADFKTGGTGSFFFNANFLGTNTIFEDATSSAYYQVMGGYNASNIQISGGAEIYLSGMQCDVPYGCAMTGTTTANGTPVIQTDSGSVPPSISGAFSADLISHAQWESYTPSVSTNWVTVPDTVSEALDALSAPKPEYDNGSPGASPAININNGDSQKLTLTANATLTLSNGHSGGAYVLRLVQGGAGSFTVTWPASVKWAGGTAPTLSTTVGAIDIIGLYFDGTNYYGTPGLNFQ